MLENLDNCTNKNLEKDKTDTVQSKFLDLFDQLDNLKTNFVTDDQNKAVLSNLLGTRDLVYKDRAQSLKKLNSAKTMDKLYIDNNSVDATVQSKFINLFDNLANSQKKTVVITKNIPRELNIKNGKEAITFIESARLKAKQKNVEREIIGKRLLMWMIIPYLVVYDMIKYYASPKEIRAQNPLRKIIKVHAYFAIFWSTLALVLIILFIMYLAKNGF